MGKTSSIRGPSRFKSRLVLSNPLVQNGLVANNGIITSQ